MNIFSASKRMQTPEPSPDRLQTNISAQSEPTGSDFKWLSHLRRRAPPSAVTGKYQPSRRSGRASNKPQRHQGLMRPSSLRPPENVKIHPQHSPITCHLIRDIPLCRTRKTVVTYYVTIALGLEL